MAGLSVFQGKLDVVPLKLLYGVLNPVGVLCDTRIMLLFRIKMITTVKRFAGVFLSFFSRYIVNPF